MVENNNSSPTPGHARSPRSHGLFIVLALLSFLLPIGMVPYGVHSGAPDKTIIFALFTIAVVLIFLVGRIFDGVIVFPRSKILLSGSIISIIYLVSATFSVNPRNSFSGTLFDTETFWIIFLLMILVFLVSISIKSIPRVAIIISALFGAGTILFVTQVLHIAFGWTFGLLGSESTSNLFGTWYNFGIFFGLLLVVSIAFLEFAPTLHFWRKVSALFCVISMVVVYLTQLNSIWISIIVIGLLICILKLRGGSAGHRIPMYALLSIGISVMALLYGGQGTSPANKMSEIVAAPLEVRPGWVSTLEVAKGAIRTSPLFGFGPNLFSRAWVKYKPLSVNATNFWFTDFNGGVGYIPSTIVSVGLLGFLAWLLFIYYVTSNLFKKSILLPRSPFHYPVILASIYVWVIAFIYLPDISILCIGAILAGMTIGLDIIDGRTNLEVISTRLFTRRKNITIFFLVVALLGTLSLAYLYVQKYRALKYYTEANALVDTDLSGTIRTLVKAISIEQSDVYYRSLAQANLVMFGNVMASQEGKDKLAIQQQLGTLYNEALSAANLAVSVDPSQYLNWVLLGNVHENMISLGVESTYEKAKEAYSKAAVVNPTSPLVAFEPARLEAAHNNPEGALPYLNRSLELKPNYARVYSFVAQLALSTGDMENAILASERAVVASPRDFSVYFQLGYLRYENRDYPGAVLDLEKSIELNTQYANAKYFLGLSYDKVGRSEDAIRMFADILATNPENNEVASILSNLRSGRGALEE